MNSPTVERTKNRADRLRKEGTPNVTSPKKNGKKERSEVTRLVEVIRAAKTHRK